MWKWDELNKELHDDFFLQLDLIQKQLVLNFDFTRSKHSKDNVSDLIKS